VRLEAESSEELLVDWLNELVAMLYGEGRIPTELRFHSIEATALDCEVRGPALPECCALKTEVKAATYHGLEIEASGRGLEATVILDV
jgi:SHS2 domain-containing protein